MKRFASLNLDFVGFMSSAVCAVHCMVVPIFLAFGLLGKNSHFLSHNVETLFFITSVSVASYVILKNIIRDKDIKNLFFFIIGLIFLSLSFVNHSHNVSDILLATLGGAALCYAHLRHWFSNHAH